MFLSGAAAATGIATINSIGNLGGFVAPNLKTVMENQFADPRAGMFALALVGIVGAILLSRLRTHNPPTSPSQLTPAQVG